MQQKTADQPIQEGGLIPVVLPTVVQRVARNTSADDVNPIGQNAKLDHIDATAGRAVMEMERIRFPKDEPLVLHTIRDEAPADDCVVLQAETALVWERNH